MDINTTEVSWNVTGTLPVSTTTPGVSTRDYDNVRNIKFHFLTIILPLGLVFNCLSIGVYR